MKDLKLETRRAEQLKAKPQDESRLGFGRIFTDHMLTVYYEEGRGWYKAEIHPYENIQMSPAAMVLHYGQAIFEGLKAYHGPHGESRLFRPRDNFERMNLSARRLRIPEIDVDSALMMLYDLLRLERDWIPKSEGTSLYIRPTIIAVDPYVGVRSSATYLFYIILSPVGAYYPEGLAPVKIYVEDEFVRAVKGGMGFAKTAGNYAASLLAGELAKEKGYSQVLWLDGVERRYIEEVGSMNIFFKIDNTLITPPLEGSILGGITRDSVIKLARDQGIPVQERRLSIDEVYEQAERGHLQEIFGTGTAAVISPVGELNWGGRILTVNDGKMGETSKAMYETLTGIQNGTVNDTHHWSFIVT